jgi:hypothetical protein
MLFLVRVRHFLALTPPARPAGLVLLGLFLLLLFIYPKYEHISPFF